MLPKKFEHHAYLLVGNRETALMALRQRLLVETGQSLEAHPDITFLTMANFGVDDSRDLKSRAISRAFSGQNKYLIISIGAITNEAQNALLKILEEPPVGTRFFLIARSAGLFLPTVISRCELVLFSSQSAEESDEDYHSAATHFLSAYPKERVKLIADWHKEERLTKDWLTGFLDVLEERLVHRERINSSRKILVETRRYLYDRALLPKMIIEYLALALPVV